MKKKKIDPAVSKFFSEMGKSGGKKSAAARIKKILENSKVGKNRPKI